jgi:hypothetical protein
MLNTETQAFHVRCEGALKQVFLPSFFWVFSTYYQSGIAPYSSITAP